MNAFLQDVRYALRLLLKSKGFTSVAVLTLALGIGANTAIFSVLNGLVLRDLSVPHPDQVVRFGVDSPNNPNPAMSLPMFEEFSKGQKIFSGTFAWWGDIVLNVETDGTLSRADVWAVDGRFYSELGALPEVGRLFSPDDVNLNAATAPRIAVLGYGFWRRHYGGARDVIGKALKIEGMPFTIIGVTRKGFCGTSAELEYEVTVPITAEPLLGGHEDVQKYLQRRDALWLEAAGRLKPDSTLEQARTQLESLWPGIRQAMAPRDKTNTELSNFSQLQIKVESGAKGTSFLRERFAKSVYAVFAITSLVLLLACVNLASFMLAHAASRSQEMGVRAALGACRMRLVQQVLTESVMLSAAGSLAGFALAYWASRALADFILGQIFFVPAQMNLSLDWRILGFTAGVAILTGVFVGLVPAWRATRADPNAALQQSSRTIAGTTGRLGKGLIVTQVAVSLVLLMGAGLFIRTFEKLRAVDPGFRTHGVLDLSLFPRPNGYKDLDQLNYYRELNDRVSSLPGVVSAGMVHASLGNVWEWTERVRISGSDTEVQADFEMVMPGFFQTVGIGLLRGRSFNWQDDKHAPRVALVSMNLAEKLFPGSDPIGQHLDVPTQPKWQNFQIVGVMTNASLYDIRKHQPATVYLPSMQYDDAMGWSELLVQTNISSRSISTILRQTVESLGHEYVTSIKKIQENIDRSMLQERVTAMLSAFLGALALLLAAIGLYGLMAYSVTHRVREIGIRVALGAPRQSILKMVVRETLLLIVLGVLVGLACAVAVTRLITHMLFELSPNDPLTLVFVVSALLTVGILAGYLPARRAMRVDPMVVLRCE